MTQSQDSIKYVNLYFQVHQPRRLRKFQFSEIGSDTSCFDDKLNAALIKRISEECYLPANRLLLDLIEKFPQIRLTFSISGSVLDQLTEYAPQVIKSFQDLAATGSIEFLGETYFHSLAYLIDNNEFIEQVKRHRKKINDLFHRQAKIFRNTDLIYCNSIGKTIFEMGFDGMYIDGVDSVLNGRNSNSLYKHPQCDFVLFPRNYVLSDDIAFRYSDRGWSEWPLTSGKLISWINRKPANEKFIGLGLGYETFGEHKKASEGIFSFLSGTISAIAKANELQFVTLSEAAELLPPQGVISTEKIISWADQEKDLSAWLGGELQRIAFDALSKLYIHVKNTRSSKLMTEYRYLQTSDHFYYMSTKKYHDDDVHESVNHYNSPYEAFKNYLNILSDFELQVKGELKKRTDPGSYKVKRNEFAETKKRSLLF